MIKKEVKVFLIILLIIILFFFLFFSKGFSFFLNKLTGKVGFGLSMCGDGICDPNENSTTCPQDCRADDRIGACGDSICSAYEDYRTCPQDCRCGNYVCEPDETPITCPYDCINEPGGGESGSCGDGDCEPPEETVDTCPADCGNLPSGTCPNGVCGPDENYETCPQDCHCGNGDCESDETPADCPNDCEYVNFPVCGNTHCESGEDIENCLADCETPALSECGNSYCESDENPATCLQDCFFQNTQTSNEQTCLDSDGGINYVEKGTVFYNGGYTDTCIDIILEEYYCTEGGHLGIDHYSCPKACVNGACMVGNGFLSPSDSGCVGSDCEKKKSFFEKILDFFRRLFS